MGLYKESATGAQNPLVFKEGAFTTESAVNPISAAPEIIN